MAEASRLKMIQIQNEKMEAKRADQIQKYASVKNSINL